MLIAPVTALPVAATEIAFAVEPTVFTVALPEMLFEPLTENVFTAPVPA